MNSRLFAAKVLSKVVKNGVSLTVALDRALPELTQTKDRAFVQALCYGVVRWYQQLDFLLGKLVAKPIKDMEVKLLALIGLYQLLHMRVRTYAAVSETVSAVPNKKTWARPLLNAVLRNFTREQAVLIASLEDDQAAFYAHPTWLYAFFKANWPEQFEQILLANNQMPPMTLRLHMRYCSRDQYRQKLQEQGLASHNHQHSPSAIILEQPVAVEQLPGFAEGWVFIQDAAAQLAVDLLDVDAGHRVLDLCAAPGGKTTHILEKYPELEHLTAVDIDTNRLQRVAENLQRLKLKAELLVGDASLPEQWWDGQLYDRILLDVPCSATGVIRRHPDIKILRRPEDIDQLVLVQQQILKASWRLLKPGGMLLYATCSVLKKENEKQIQAFIESNANAQHQEINADWGELRGYGRQVLTGDCQMDGFYYACICKV